jgi:hypothetical protein
MSAIRNLIAEANSAMAILQDFQIKDDQLNQQIVELQQRLSGLLQDRAELVPLLEEARGKEMKAQADLRAFYQQAPPLPASPPASPKEQGKKKGGRKPYSPEQKAAAKARHAMEKATRQLLIAGPDCPEKEKALEKQAKIDAQVAKMQAGLKVWKAGQKMPELEGSESELEEVAHA